MSLSISYDENLISELTAKFDLRTPNAEALSALVKRIESGNFDPSEPLVLDLATAVGKTYILASFIEYLRKQGAMNVMVVTPGTVVQDKTVRDLTEGTDRYVGGFDVAPRVVTPTNVRELTSGSDTNYLVGGEQASTVYVFNVQQLFPPKEGGKNVASGEEAARRKVYLFQEDSGVLAERLIETKDLVIIADESHLFGKSAEVFRSSLTNLKPAVTVGLTASPDKKDDVVYRYPLWRAIMDGYVKQPVLVYRSGGYKTEERQLQDAVSLLRFKEEQYKNYREKHPEGKQTQPLLFVVCSDVNHATETTEYLRNTHFPTSATLGQTVLQVDNKHNDATTQTLLRNLDLPHSPIRAIVSVNKLREGWDTKRIAVMCTLRAMGSEVLTQQVMGRGLRLPFGKTTGVNAVDQLEIISHKSFVDLLKSEDVLREFGIEEDMPVDPVIVDPGTGESTTITGVDTRDQAAVIAPETSPDFGLSDSAVSGNSGGTTGTPPAVGVRGLTDNEPIAPAAVPQPVVVKINARFAGTEFLFPTTAMTETTRPFALVDVETDAVKRAARNVKDSEEHLDRTIIVARDGGEIAAEATDRVAVPSFRQSTKSVVDELIRRVVRTGRVQATTENDLQLRQFIVPTFMQETGITQWTEKSKQSAVVALTSMIVEQAKQAAHKNRFTEVTIIPKSLPVADEYELPASDSVREPIDMSLSPKEARARFVSHKHYGNWSKGLFEAAKFDSFSAEYALAHLLNYDPTVQWWTRIYPEHGAHIAYTTRNKYIPDFVVFDTKNTFWIIEGKGEDKREDELVGQKKQATEHVLRLLLSRPDFEGQRWGYVLAFEDDIRVADSLDDLISGQHVVRL